MQSALTLQEVLMKLLPELRELMIQEIEKMNMGAGGQQMAQRPQMGALGNM